MQKRTGGRQLKRERQIAVYRQLAMLGVAALAALILAYCLIASGYRKKFLRNTYINELNVSKKTAEEAEAMLKDSVEQYALTLKFQDGAEETLKSRDLGLVYRSSGEAKTLLEHQKRMSWLSRLFGKTETHQVETSYDFDQTLTEQAITALPEFQAENVTEPKDAYVKLNDNQEFEIVPEVDGNALDQSVVCSLAEEAVRHGTGVLDLTKEEGTYLRPSVRSNDEELVKDAADLNAFISTTVTISLDKDKKTRTIETISREKLISWLSENEDGSYFIDSDKIADRAWTLVQRMAKRYDDAKTTMKFPTTKLGTKTLSCDPYGYKIDVDAVAEQLYDDVMACKDDEITIKNSVDETADSTFGGNYIEVDVTNQHVWFYKDGKLFLETDCVTGLESDPERKTPSGVFAIYGKDENKTLEGRLTADGPVTYASDVDCWMPFYESYGMHDAPWRDQFGGDIYLTAGSHGCVNLPVPAAKTIFEHAPVGTTVVVIRASDE